MKKFKFLIIISVLFLSTFYSKAEIIKDIIISGNERITKDTILVLGKVNIEDDLDSNDLNIILKNLYETNFFKNIDIKLKNGNLLINVTENSIIQEVKFNGIKKKELQEFLYDNLNLKNKNSFVEYLAEKDLEIITNLLQQFGYYFVNVKSKIIENQNKTIDLVYDVDLGD